MPNVATRASRLRLARLGSRAKMSAKADEYAVLSPGQISQFHALGFMAMERITSEEDVGEIYQIVERLFQTKAGHREGAHFNFAGSEEDPDAPSIPQIVSPHTYAKRLKATRFYRNALSVAEQLLGAEVRFNSDHTLMKPALDSPATPWHQDEAFRDPSYVYNEISIWMPLQKVDQLNGCLKFIPRSHLGHVLPHRPLNNDPKVHALECLKGFDPADAVSCALNAGGCTVHTGRTLHAAGPNFSDRPRLAYVLTFSTPPQLQPQPQVFAWLQNQDTARMRRARLWLRRGGVFVAFWRVCRGTHVRDYLKLGSKLRRKARIFLALQTERK
jgi:ectoine hydroxylase-related dioxygenase (phytanoyl-CoA dioxygenase family)